MLIVRIVPVMIVKAASRSNPYLLTIMSAIVLPDTPFFRLLITTVRTSLLYCAKVFIILVPFRVLGFNLLFVSFSDAKIQQ